MQPPPYVPTSVRIVSHDPSFNQQMHDLLIAANQVNRVGVAASTLAVIDGFLSYAAPTLLTDPDAVVNTSNGGRFFLAVVGKSETDGQDSSTGTSTTNGNSESVKDEPPVLEVVGMIGVAREDKHVEAGHAELIRIAVHPDWHRKSIGTRLITHAMEYARRELRTKRVYLYTLASLPSGPNAYRRCGFKEKVFDKGELFKGSKDPVIHFWIDFEE